MSITRIAQAAKVSYATAWRVINNRPCGSPEAVAAVKQAMGQLGYKPAQVSSRRGRPSKSANGIRTRNIALLHLREGTALSASVLSRVQTMLAEMDLNLIYSHGKDEDSLPQAVRTGNVDGILGYGQLPDGAINEKLSRIPAVWMMSRSDARVDPFGDRVKPDHTAIGQLAAQYLISRGHKNLAYMNPDSTFTLYQQRFMAFHGAAEDARADLQVFGVSGSTNMDFVAERLVDQWLGSTPRPTGIFVPVDRATICVHRHMERRGIHPGHDVDIVSCDNEKELLSLMNPPPPSVDLNRPTIARLAVERLLWRMKNGTSSPNIAITVTPTLVMPAEVV